VSLFEQLKEPAHDIFLLVDQTTLDYCTFMRTTQ